MVTTAILVCVVIILIILSMTIACVGIYNIYKDRISKEIMFQIQLMSAENASIKDAIPVVDLYKVVDDTIKFYAARRLKMSNLADKSEQELSLMIDDIILNVSSDVELHLGERFKKIWEIYFDPIPVNQNDPPSHLNLYIHDNTELILIRTIESLKMNSKDRDDQPTK